METTIRVVALVLVYGIVLAIVFGINYVAYWLVLKAGAPKYIAVIFGIVTVLLLNIRNNSK
jgi:hypothetical protein